HRINQRPQLLFRAAPATPHTHHEAIKGGLTPLGCFARVRGGRHGGRRSALGRRIRGVRMVACVKGGLTPLGCFAPLPPGPHGGRRSALRRRIRGGGTAARVKGGLTPLHGRLAVMTVTGFSAASRWPPASGLRRDAWIVVAVTSSPARCSIVGPIRSTSASVT